MSTLSSVGVVGLGATARGVIPATRRGARARVAARPVASTRAGETSSSVAWAHRGSRRVNSGARGDAVVRRGFLDRLFGGDKKGSDDAKGDDTGASKPADAPEADAEASHRGANGNGINRWIRSGRRPIARSHAQGAGRVRHAQARLQ